ncbi:sigma-70 family RNA polymerase sigma factor [Flavimarina sp. Hel_I_48]|uniref:sigma-70 family RNA polymerase sigma factor n=1 Tax=Flavimarina sp. Hel_I_48 TaxID=1392488 RepID=UPI001F12CAF8|nr:sigma-70 family RNA polymerase sigma factor [Flavimarina sp. Hel_I_48]
MKIASRRFLLRFGTREKKPSILNLEGYLFRAVKYKVATQLRDLKFTRAQDEVLQQIPVSSKVDTNLEYQDFERFLNARIEQLAPRCRKVFMLSRFEHYSNGEIADQLNISIRTVEKHISDAIKELRAGLAHPSL